jgi:hypothetical protein
MEMKQLRAVRRYVQIKTCSGQVIAASFVPNYDFKTFSARLASETRTTSNPFFALGGVAQ